MPPKRITKKARQEKILADEPQWSNDRTPLAFLREAMELCVTRTDSEQQREVPLTRTKHPVTGKIVAAVVNDDVDAWIEERLSVRRGYVVSPDHIRANLAKIIARENDELSRKLWKLVVKFGFDAVMRRMESGREDGWHEQRGKATANGPAA